VLLIAASILAARKLAQYDGGARVPADDNGNWGRRALGGTNHASDSMSGGRLAPVSLSLHCARIAP
jgi:hypothetical protein